MSTVVSGTVRQGVVVPSSPLPEGAIVEIVLRGDSLTFSPDLQSEIEDWDRASAKALRLVERSST